MRIKEQINSQCCNFKHLFKLIVSAFKWFSTFKFFTKLLDKEQSEEEQWKER